MREKYKPTVVQVVVRDEEVFEWFERERDNLGLSSSAFGNMLFMQAKKEKEKEGEE